MAKKKLKWPFSEERKHYLTLKHVVVYESDAETLSNASKRTMFASGTFLRSAVNPNSRYYNHCGNWEISLHDSMVPVNPKVGVLAPETFRTSKREYNQMVVKADMFSCTELSIYFGFSGKPCKKGDLPCCKLT